MRYDLTSMELFIAVAEERNVTRAARRCHLAVSALSKRIAELEIQAGAPLLLRHARGVELTPAGESLVHYARQVRLTLGQMDEELASYAAGVRGHVRIHAIASALARFLPDDVERFMQRYPLIRFDIEERVGTAVVQAVVEGRADIGIFAQHTPAQGLLTRVYRHDQLMLVMSRDHRLSGAGPIDFATALEHEFVGPHLDSQLYTLFEQQMAQGGQQMQVRVRASSFECMCRLVAAGIGVAVLPRTAVEAHVRALKLRSRPLADAWATRTLVVGTRPVEMLPPNVRTLVEHLSL